MRVLITRPAGDAQAAAAQLRAQGHDVLACPLIGIEKTPDQKLSLAATQGFIVTDADGARALAETVGVRTFPVFCDSAGTAAELALLGFQDARSADGDAPAIARLIERSLTPKLGGLVYACSTSAPINLSTMLGNAGFAVRMTALFAVGRVEVLPRVIADALTSGALDAVAFFSAEEARAFAQLVQRANLDITTEKLIAIVAAPVIAAPLTVLKFARVVSAPKSDAASVMAMVRDDLLRQPEPQVVVAEPVIVAPEPVPQAIEPVVVLPEPTPEPEPEPEIVAPESLPAALVETPPPAPIPEPIAEIEPDTVEPQASVEVTPKRSFLDALGSLFARRGVPPLNQQPSPPEAQETSETAGSVIAETEPAEKLPPVEVIEPTAKIAEPAPIAVDEPVLPAQTIVPVAEFIETIEPPTSGSTPEPVVESEPVAVDQPANDGTIKKKSLLTVLGSLISRTTKKRATEIPSTEPALIVAADTEPVAPEPAPEIEVAPEPIVESVAPEEPLIDSSVAIETPASPAEPESIVDEVQLLEPVALPRESIFEKARRFLARPSRPTHGPSALITAEPAPEVVTEPVDQPSELKPSVATTTVAVIEPPTEVVTNPEPAAIEVASREAEEIAAVVEDPPKPAEVEQTETQKISVWSSVKALFARKEAAPRPALDDQPSTEPLAETQQEQPEAAQPPDVLQQPLPEAKLPEPEPDPVVEAEPEPEPIPEPPVIEPSPENIAPEKSPQKESPLSTIPTVAGTSTPAMPELQPAVARTDIEQTVMNDSTPPPMTDVSESNERQTKDAETPRVTRGGGRAARLLAEDAADARALNQRFKVPGGEPEQEAVETPSTATISESMGSTLSGAAMARPARGLPRAVYVVLAIIVIAIVVVVAEPSWVTQLRGTPSASTALEKTQLVSATPATDQLAALNARTDALAKEVAALNARLAVVEQRGAPTQSADTTALEQRIAALETAAKAKSPDDLSASVTNQARLLTNLSARIATLESGIGNIAKVEDLATRLAALEGKSAEANSVLALSERVGAIEKRDSVAATALVVATAQLRDVVRSGRPYAVELETVIQLAKRANTSFDTEALMLAAAKGLARADTIKASFPDMAAAAVRSGVVPGDTAGWFKRVLDRALSIVSLRPFGNVEGTTPGAILARAEQALRADNLAGAVSEVETLTGAPAQAATAWLAQAKAQVTAERALEELASRSVGAMSALTQTKPTASSP